MTDQNIYDSDSEPPSSESVQQLCLSEDRGRGGERNRADDAEHRARSDHQKRKKIRKKNKCSSAQKVAAIFEFDDNDSALSDQTKVDTPEILANPRSSNESHSSIHHEQIGNQPSIRTYSAVSVTLQSRLASKGTSTLLSTGRQRRDSIMTSSHSATSSTSENYCTPNRPILQKPKRLHGTTVAATDNDFEDDLGTDGEIE